MSHDDTPKGDRERSEFKISRRKTIKKGSETAEHVMGIGQ